MAYGTVAVTAGAGTDVAFDTVSGAKFQRVKLAFGGEGTAIEPSSSAPLPVLPPAITLHAQFLAAASNNPGTVKASAGTLKRVRIFNRSAAPVYVHIYNKASNPTVGTDTVILTFGCQAGDKADYPISDGGLAFATGIARAMTTTIDGSSGNTAVNDAVVTIEYV
jgi:hypothetical protein